MRFLRILILALGSATLALSLLGFLDDRFWSAEIASSLRVHLLISALALALVALIARSFVGAGLAVLALAFNAFVLVPFFTDDLAAASGTERLLIAHVNMQHHDGDFEVVRRALEDREPDVLVILEPSRAWTSKTSPSGYRVFVRDGRPEPRILVFTRERVSNVGFPFDPTLPTASVTFDVELGGLLVHALAVHTAAPTTPGGRAVRNRELDAASTWARRSLTPTVVFGDLNATPWSSALQRLEDSADLRNSTYGYGVQATWPTRAGPLGVPIDQLLHSGGLTVTDRATGPSFGSEHRSLWVTIARASARQAPG